MGTIYKQELENMLNGTFVDIYEQFSYKSDKQKAYVEQILWRKCQQILSAISSVWVHTLLVSGLKEEYAKWINNLCYDLKHKDMDYWFKWAKTNFYPIVRERLLMIKDIKEPIQQWKK